MVTAVAYQELAMPPITRHPTRPLTLLAAGVAALVGLVGPAPSGARAATAPVAFPGAVGVGAAATGGRGGAVYHVTNLDDSGAGSFRDAVSASHRIVVFDVGGYVQLGSAVSVKSNLTIAGQTAPGGGIGIMGREVSFSGASNDIVRDIRFRQGDLDADSGKSGINLLNASTMIFDHVSIEFGQWDDIDAVGATNVTVQNSIDADPIGQQFGAHTETGPFTWYGDLFANAHNRNPLAKANTQYVNNVVYDYQAGYTAGNSSGHFLHDVVGNYFIAGPRTTSASNAYYQLGNQSVYNSGNVLDANRDGALNGSALALGAGATALASPWNATTTALATRTAAAAYTQVTGHAGAVPRDQVDAQVVADTTSLGTAGNLWSHQTATGLGNDGYGTIAGGTAPADTDRDGMPDAWETRYGLNPTDPSDATGDFDRTGYTNIEKYLNGRLDGGYPTAATVHPDVTASFTPGAAWTDTSGNTLQLHGLGIVRVGSTWYGFGENKQGESSSNAAFQSVACYSSTDLAHWTYQRAALSVQASGDLGPNRVVERPKVLYNGSTATYVMYLHIDSSSYGEAKVGVATSTTPCGGYTYRGSFQPLGQQSRDLGLFQDTDGTGYLLTEDRANGLRIDRLSADYLSVTAAVAVFADYEAPAMVKSGGRYWLLASHLSGWSANDNVYATATSLTGGWSAFRPLAPVGTSTYTSQIANVIAVQGSAGTTFVYAGDRWTTADLGSSPLIWLPLTLSGSTAALGWQRSWTLDLAAGTWTGTSNPANGSRHLTAANSGLLMDVSGGSTADGAAVIQWTATGGGNQTWTLTRVTGNVYTLTGTGSAKCLEVPDNSTAQGTRLDIWTCNGGANQQWALTATGSYTSAGSASYTLVNVNSGLVADVVGGATTTGASIEQWPANGGSNQTWTVSG
jgi:hypothetical protein